MGNMAHAPQKSILNTSKFSESTILEVGLIMSKVQVDSTKRWTSDLDFRLKVMPKYKI